MTVEAASFIDDLVATNPTTTDFLYEGDDHIRLLKAVLLASFPNVGAAVTLTHTQINASLRTDTAGQWSLMNSTTVSGSPSVVEFKSGTGGVVISALYDQYLIDFTNIKSSGGAATLRMEISENAGGAYPANATGCAWESDYISSTSTLSRGTGSAFLTLANIGLPATDPGISGQILICRPLSLDLKCAVFAQITYPDPAGVGMITTHGVVASTTNQFDAVRLSLSAGTFPGTTTRVRLYGRRA
jgi:hypothetical protein